MREKPRGLTAAESMGVAAWNLRASRAYATAKANRPAEGLRWDVEGETPLIPPDGPGMTHTADEQPALGFGAALDDTSLYLIGSVAVGIIIVEGPTADLQFSDEERTKVVAEVQEGLTWLGTREPKAGVSFVYDIRPPVQLNLAPNPSLSGYEPMEAHWRDPAMAKIGFAANFGGVREYVKTIRANNGTKWAYVAFFTKYPTNHFAYASKPRLVMQYANDNWGPDNIDRVFTHETGHIFGCPDEYAASGCSTTTKAGFLQEVNGNCQNGAAAFTPCLMAGNTWEMCSYTPTHFGWRDTDGDGALDPVDPVGNPNPLIDLSKLCAFVPFICQLFGINPGGAPAGGPVGVAGGVAGRWHWGRWTTTTRVCARGAPAPGADTGRAGPRRGCDAVRGAALPRGARTQAAHGGRHHRPGQSAGPMTRRGRRTGRHLSLTPAVRTRRPMLECRQARAGSRG